MGAGGSTDCGYNGNNPGYPFTETPSKLKDHPMNDVYFNEKACTTNNQGNSMYKNGEFMVDGQGGSCLRREWNGSSQEDICYNGGSSGGCGRPTTI